MVKQSSTNAALHAALAIDGNPGTYSETLDLTNSYWLLTLDRARPINRVELVNRSDANAARLQGLTLRVLDNSSNSIASATVSNPGAGNNWVCSAPPGTVGRYIFVGLENGATNGQGNRIVSLAEVNLLPATNFALNAVSFMTRSTDVLPPTANGNDGNYSTSVQTHNSTVDGYWEVDLGQPLALYSVRTIAGDGFQSRLTHATVRLFDEALNSIYSQHLSGTSEVFDTDVPGPVIARYVRVGTENKERTSGTTANEWFIGMKEVQVFGRATNEVGILSFTATATQILAGASTTLQWQESGLYRLDLYPSIGSVGADTASSGLGSRSVPLTNSTEFLLVGATYTNTFTRSLTINVNGSNLPPRITEFVANNKYSLRDGNNAPSDWIELHNPNNTPLNLTGYGLSDDPLFPIKWTFPSNVIVSPHGYLIVFASDSGPEGTYDPARFLHANFNLNQDGESIVLTSSNGLITIDAVTNYPAQMEDLAYGRTLDGQWTFLEPTPGAPNLAPAYQGWLQPIDYSHKRGWYTNAISLTISSANPGSQAFYAVDGTEPTNLYTGALSITNTIGVRAAVRRTGYKSPRTKTHTYLFLDGIMASTVMSTTYTQDPNYTNRMRQGLRELPTICVNLPPAPPVLNSEREERQASVEIFMPDGSDRQENCGITHFGGAFGNGTGNPYAKKSYQLKFRAEYGTSRLQLPLFQGFDHGLLAQDEFDEIDLHAGNHDISARGFYLSHRFAADTMLDMGNLNPHGRFVHLYINGVYWGQYDAHERLTDSFLSEYLGGSKENYLPVRGNDNTSAGFILGVPEPPDRLAWETVRSNRNSYALVKDSLDVTNLIDFMLVWNWGNAEAEFRAAGARQPGVKGFEFWLADADGHLRNQSGVASALTRNGTAITGPGLIFGALLAEGHPDFKALLADRIYKHFFNNGAMTATANETRMNARMFEVTNSLVAECARWGSTMGRTPANWEGDAQYARDNLFPYRNANLLTYMRNAGWYPLLDAPVANQYGGSVASGFQLALTVVAGTLYYTLDGSDPRLAGGGIAPGVLAWTNPAAQFPLGSTWRYFNTNVAPAGSWQSLAFNDSTWQSGAGPFGYGNGNETTVLSFGTNANNRFVSYYFRKTFMVTNPAANVDLKLDLVCDDGAVVYLNGTELLRNNMPGGTLVYSTLASSSIPDGVTEEMPTPFILPSSLLVSGTNVIAVEVHNVATNSADIRFDLGLAGRAIFNVTVQSNMTISTRVRNGTNWSALAQPSFIIAPLRQPTVGDIVISEINYNPEGVDDYEYIELYNLSTNLLDLTNVRLTDGVDFLFPNNFYLAPGAFTLVVENAAAFAQRYRTNTSPYYYPNLLVAGTWSGQLNNSGERIALVASNNTELCAVSYENGGAWPARADGKGSSLELRNPAAVISTNLTTLDNNLARGANWRSSSLYHGSPGRPDSQPREMVISEVIAHTDIGVDWIELQNTTGSSITLSNYFLSDNYEQPFRYAFPPDTVAAGGFLVCSANQLGFGFSELGSDILLVQASGTNVVRFVDTTDIPAVDREEPIGRYTRSDGVVDFTELRSTTQGATNDLPRVGPIVFSEIMYHPTNGNAEYVEIVNITGTNVLLYDPAFPTNRWQLSDAVNFTFPPFQFLAPGAVAIICATNPTTFRAQYGVSMTFPVYGSWTGALNNAGDSLRLRRPGDPETNGVVPYYRVDRVRYEPLSPWPEAADTGGMSLERVTLEGYGNDPINWQPSVPTPGSFVGNRQPNLSVSGDTTVVEGLPVNLTVLGTDLDQPWQAVTLSAQNLPGGSFDPNNGTFTWTPGEGYGPGVYSLKFLATDNGLYPLVRTQIVSLIVLESNQPPSLQPVAGFAFPALTPLTLDLVAIDPDLPPQALSYAAIGLPTGLSINPLTGRINGSAQTQGTYPVIVSVADNQLPALTATNSFTLTITPPFQTQVGFSGGQPQFSFQSIPGQSYDVQFTYSLSSPNWQLLRHITSAPGGAVTITSPPQSSNSFIRVLWMRQ
jgi:hypothetical protein